MGGSRSRHGLIPEHLQYLETNSGKVYAQIYDMVLNDNELGSGSVRINRPDIQERVMKWSA